MRNIKKIITTISKISCAFGILSLHTTSNAQIVVRTNAVNETPENRQEIYSQQSLEWTEKINALINNHNPENLNTITDMSKFENLDLNQQRRIIESQISSSAQIDRDLALKIYTNKAKLEQSRPDIKIAELFKIVHTFQTLEDIEKFTPYTKDEDWLVVMYALALRAINLYTNLGSEYLAHKKYRLFYLIPSENHPLYAEAKYLEAQDQSTSYLLEDDLHSTYKSLLDQIKWGKEIGNDSISIIAAFNLTQIYARVYGESKVIDISQSIINKVKNNPQFLNIATVVHASYLNDTGDYPAVIKLLSEANYNSSQIYSRSFGNRQLAFAYAMSGKTDKADAILKLPETQGASSDDTYNYNPRVHQAKLIITLSQSKTPINLEAIKEISFVYKREIRDAYKTVTKPEIKYGASTLDTPPKRFYSQDIDFNQNVDYTFIQNLNANSQKTLKELVNAIPTAHDLRQNSEKGIYMVLDDVNNYTPKPVSSYEYPPNQSNLQTAIAYSLSTISSPTHLFLTIPRETTTNTAFLENIKSNRVLNKFEESYMDILNIHNYFNSKDYHELSKLLASTKHNVKLKNKERANLLFDLSAVEMKFYAVHGDMNSAITSIDSHIRLALETKRPINKNQIVTILIELLTTNGHIDEARRFTHLLKDEKSKFKFDTSYIDTKMLNAQGRHKEALSYFDATKEQEYSNDKYNTAILFEKLKAYTNTNDIKNSLETRNAIISILNLNPDSQISEYYNTELLEANYRINKSQDNPNSEVLRKELNNWKAALSEKATKNITNYEVIASARSYANEQEMLKVSQRAETSENKNREYQTKSRILIVFTGLLLLILSSTLFKIYRASSISNEKNLNQITKDNSVTDHSNKIASIARERLSTLSRMLKNLQSSITDIRHEPLIETIKSEVNDVQDTFNNEIIMMRINSNNDIELSDLINFHTYKNILEDHWEQELRNLDITFKVNVPATLPIMKTNILFLEAALREIYKNAQKRTLHGHIKTNVEYVRNNNAETLKITIWDTGHNTGFENHAYQITNITITRLKGSFELNTRPNGEKQVIITIPVIKTNFAPDKPENDQNIIRFKK